MTDYFDKKSIEQFSRQEFLEFVRLLGDPSGRTEKEDNRWIAHFDKLVYPDPRKNGILFYPEFGKESDEAVVEEVERYRRENGLPGFKDSDF